MLKAVFQKKWTYGNPEIIELQEGDWPRWLRFVNIIADDHKPNTQILTAWDKDGMLYGYSQAIFDEEELPASGLDAVVNVDGIEEAIHEAEAVDFSINTHQDLIPIARRVIKWIERMEQRHNDKLDAIKALVQ
jgi:hypothetical protein